MKLKHNLVGCLIELDTGNGNIISQPWGAELGDWHQYWNQYLHQKQSKIKKKKNSFENEFTLPNFNIEVKQKESWKEDKIKREYKFELKKDMMLGDTVSRITFKKNAFEYAEINEKKVYHKNLNKYYQEKTNEVKLFGKNNLVIKSKASISKNLKKKFDFTMYVRDEPIGSWIIHSRWIAKYPGDELICRSRPKNIRVPSFLFGKRFYLARERNPKIPVNCGANVWCEKGDWFKIKTEVVIL